MPHAGLMDADALGPEAAPLQRARLHIRAGRRRLSQGKIAAGIVTLYDALTSAMEWYPQSPERRSNLKLSEGDDLSDDRIKFRVFDRSGMFGARFDYKSFNDIVEEALDHELPGFDYHELLEGVEAVMTRFGIMPFDEDKLPPEDPATY